VVVARAPISSKFFPQILTNQCENPAPQKTKKKKKKQGKKEKKTQTLFFL